MRCDIAGRAKQREYIERWRWRMSGFGWRVNWKLMRRGYGIIKRTDRWLNLLDWLPNHMPREEHITLIAHTQIADHIATELNTRIEYNYTRIGTRPDQTGPVETGEGSYPMTERAAMRWCVAVAVYGDGFMKMTMMMTAMRPHTSAHLLKNTPISYIEVESAGGRGDQSDMRAQ